MIDAKINFEEYLEYANDKAANIKLLVQMTQNKAADYLWRSVSL